MQATAKQKADAQAEKELGNAAYKKKDFEAALQHYGKALELYDGDISFLTNRWGAICLTPHTTVHEE